MSVVRSSPGVCDSLVLSAVIIYYNRVISKNKRLINTVDMYGWCGNLHKLFLLYSRQSQIDDNAFN